MVVFGKAFLKNFPEIKKEDDSKDCIGNPFSRQVVSNFSKKKKKKKIENSSQILYQSGEIWEL